MIALTTLGVICILLVCFGPVISLIGCIYSEDEPSIVGKSGKRKLKINRINFWDYLLLIVPACLLLVGLFSKNLNERSASFTILGIGYMLLILSSYNRRIDIPKINWFIFLVCLVSAITAFVLKNHKEGLILLSGVNSLETLYFPPLAYIYLQAGKVIIKMATGTYPITLDRNYRVGTFHFRYQRTTNYWDLVWTLFNLIIIPLIMIYLTVAE